MLRVGLDTSALDTGFKSHAFRGIGRYVYELSRYFAARAEAEGETPVAVGNFSFREVGVSRVLSGMADCLPYGRQTVKQQLLYPVRLGSKARLPFDVLHFPAQTDAPSWCPRKYVVTVLDLIPLVLKDLYQAARPGWRFNLARWLEIKAIKHSSLILAISENTANDVVRLLGVSRDKIVVTPLGVDERFFKARVVEPESALRARYGLPPGRPIIIYVGGIDQRKNMPILIGAYQELLNTWRDNRSPKPVLLMVGEIESDAEYPKLLNYLKTHGLEREVLRPGYVPDEDLLQLYALSSVFFFPSLYEGFGLPPLEAMAAGLPVVSSDAASLPEVLGDAALTFSPDDGPSAVRLLKQVFESADVRADLSARGRIRAQKFSWAETGRLTLGAYARLQGAN